MSTANIIIMGKREDPFARVPKSVLSNRLLSWRAKGLLAYLLGKPAGWKVRRRELEMQSTDGAHSVRAGLDELRAVGYAKLEKITERGKFKEWVWKISDCPIFKPDVDSPSVENPPAKNRHLSKNEATKKDATETESKESKETSPAEDVIFASTWQPNPKDKKAQLQAIRPPQDYPSQVEFEAFCSAECIDHVFDNYRPDIYGDLCRTKWHQWHTMANRWIPIQDWRKYVSALAEHIESGMER